MNCKSQKILDSIIANVFFIRFIIMIIIYMNSSNIYHVWTLLLLDSLKGIPIRASCDEHPLVANSERYQFWDKILDSLGYIMSLEIIERNKILDSHEIKILKVSLYYRFIGAFLYLFTGNRKLLFYFPDMFKELIFIYTNKFNTYWIVPILFVKIYIEYRLHYTMEGTNILKVLMNEN